MKRNKIRDIFRKMIPTYNTTKILGNYKFILAELCNIFLSLFLLQAAAITRTNKIKSTVWNLSLRDIKFTEAPPFETRKN